MAFDGRQEGDVQGISHRGEKLLELQVECCLVDPNGIYRKAINSQESILCELDSNGIHAIGGDRHGRSRESGGRGSQRGDWARLETTTRAQAGLQFRLGCK